MTAVNNTVLCIFVKRVIGLKSSYHKEKILQLQVVMNVNQTYCGDHLTIYTKWNHYCIHLKLTMLHVNYITIFRVVKKRIGFPGGSVVKIPPNNLGNTGDVSSIPGLGRSPGGGNGNPLQYSCLEIPWTEKPGGLQYIGSQRVEHN